MDLKEISFTSISVCMLSTSPLVSFGIDNEG